MIVKLQLVDIMLIVLYTYPEYDFGIRRFVSRYCCSYIKSFSGGSRFYISLINSTQILKIK
ncbi:hypothetical protein pb186bvf_005776 [Paramecium bursaria]